MKRYKPYIFCDVRRNRDAFPHQHVFIDPNHKKLEQMLQDHSFKLIHARFGMAGLKMMALKKKWRIPLITSFHGYDSPAGPMFKKKKEKLRQLFSIGDCFTTPSKEMRDILIKHGCPKHKIEVHYSGIDLNKFSYKERVFPTDGAVRIVFVGRLVEKKGADLLIKAFSKVRESFPNTRLTIIGEGKLGPKLKRLRKKLHQEKHIDFIGALPHDEVAKHLEQAHLFCLPSRKDSTGNQEGIPNAIKEAMACGLPVVSTFHAGIPELITDGESGHLVEEKNTGAIAEKLIQLIRFPETWAQLGRNARAKIEADFNLHTQKDKLERLFDRVIAEHERRENKQPFFSVIIPTYNRAGFLRKAINSVLRQTCSDYELIVVDDGSKDATAKAVRSYGAQVRYIYQKNKGPSEARNTGIQHARGKYIAFLDSDDQFLPDKLRHNKIFIEKHPNLHFLYSWYYSVKRGRKRILESKLKSYHDLRSFHKELYNRDLTIRTSTVVVHRSCFDKVGGFNPKYVYSQDWDMWLRLACYYPGHCQKLPLSLYRRHYRKLIPANKRHQKIRKNAKKLFKASSIKSTK